MKTNVILSLILAVIWSGGVLHAQTLADLHLGDDAERLSSLGRPVVIDRYKQLTVRRWKLTNGNDLSVTTDRAGKIVYMESDWNGSNTSPLIDLPGLTFGTTTLSDIRKRFSSNGFGFKNRGTAIETDDGIVMMNSYEIGNDVVTFFTKVSSDYLAIPEEARQKASIADHAKLDAIAICTADYAQTEWGDRVYDPAYKKVRWQ